MSDTLQFLLGTVHKADFLDKYYRKSALRVPSNPNRFTTLFGWNSLNDVLNTSPQPHPGVKLSFKGKQQRPKDAVSLIQAVQEGATLILENIDRYCRSLGSFLNQFTEETGEEARLNMYLSYPGAQGYKIHYDTQDFFILQISGYKKWRVFPETTKSVLFNQKYHDSEPPPDSSCYMDCLLEPGDVLYVPRGHWHYAMADKEPSLHLTLALFSSTGIDFMQWLVDELTEYEHFRKRFPSSEHELYTDYQIGVAHVATLKEKLDEIWNEEKLYSEFTRFKAAVSKNRHPFNFPRHIVPPENHREAYQFRRNIQHARIFLEEDKVKVVCGGRLLTFEASAEPILRYIFSVDNFTKKDLFSVYDTEVEWEYVFSILSPLITEGFVLCEQ